MCITQFEVVVLMPVLKYLKREVSILPNKQACSSLSPTEKDLKEANT